MGNVGIDGQIDLTAKGGVSADNPLKANITMRLIATAGKIEPSSIVVKYSGAFLEPYVVNPAHPFGGYAAQLLRKQGDIWTGETSLRYNQAGNLTIFVEIDGKLVPICAYVQVESEAVTATNRTNALTISLTFAILAFAVLELRVDNYRHERN